MGTRQGRLLNTWETLVSVEAELRGAGEKSTNGNGARKLHILVVYSAYTTRTNLVDSLYSFRSYTNHYIYYYNIRLRRIPKLFLSIKFDLVVFHTLFFSNKFERERQVRLFEKVYALCEAQSRKVITPQDEFVNSDIVCDFIKKTGIDAVFTVQPRNVWKAIYGSVDEQTKIYGVLTGYLDRKRIAECAHLLSPGRQRQITVGYRAIAKPVVWWGRHGYLKERIAKVFEQQLRLSQVDFDISTDEKDAKSSLSWYSFLGNCKYTLGVESGTSLLDFDGSIKRTTEDYLRAHPHASFEEIEAACFPHLDGHFEGYEISPRHLEACMTGTCQILTEGSYSGILKPNIHYIPVAKDFHNINEVIELIKSDHRRSEIVDNAYRDIVMSGMCDMEIFPATVIGEPWRYPIHTYGYGSKLKMYVLFLALRALDFIDRYIAIIVNHTRRCLGKR